jgi:hypothetical protein
VPARVADEQQRRPARRAVGTDRNAGIGGERGSHPVDFTEDRGRPEVVAGQAGVVPQQLDRPMSADGVVPRHLAGDAGVQERPCPLGPVHGPAVDLGLELRPAGEAEVAGQGQLGPSQRDRELGLEVAADPGDGRRVASPGSVAQLLGLPPELVEVGPVGESLDGHVISSPAPSGPRQATHRR